MSTVLSRPCAVNSAAVYKNTPGLLLVVSLVALRVVIGMHFFREGLNKIREPRSFSAAFFENAQGPFAPSYHSLVWDRDGLARLNRDATLRQWDQFLAQVERHYGFDEEQKARAEKAKTRHQSALRDYFAEKSDDIREYRGNLDRRNEYARDRQRQETASLRAQLDRIEAEIRAKRPSLVGPIDAMWRAYARDLNALASREQRARGSLALAKPGRRVLDTESLDAVIPWFDLTIGVLLISGLLTGPASLAGAAFLFSVAASQWPWAPQAIPSWYQAIEGLALLVVAAAGAGRYAGFDALLASIFSRPRPVTRSA
jgi:uncharacterized membrane protein YphA (DoxX/SURF4 family)